MRFLKVVFLASSIIFLLSACSGKKMEGTSGTDEIHINENSVLCVYAETNNQDTDNPSDFKITIKKDGSYSCVESVIQSSVTSGRWSISDGILVLEDVNGKNYFNIEKDKITFISDGSDNFRIVKLRDKDTFINNQSKNSENIE